MWKLIKQNLQKALESSEFLHKFQESFQKAQDDPNVLPEAKRLFYQGSEAFLNTDISAAMSCWNQAINLDGSYSHAYAWLGISYRYQEQYKKTVELCNKALKLNSDIFCAYYYRGCAYTALYQYKAAISDFEHCINIDSSFFDSYLGLMYIFEDIKEYKKILEYCNKVIKKGFNNVRFYCIKGKAYMNLEMYTEAFVTFEQALKYDENCACTLINRGWIYKRQYQYSKALADFEEAIKKQPGLWLGWENRGHIIYILNGYDAAIQAFNDGLKHPEIKTQSLGRAQLYYAKAKTHYRRARSSYHNGSRDEASTRILEALTAYSKADEIIKHDFVYTPDRLRIIRDWIKAIRFVENSELEKKVNLVAIHCFETFFDEVDSLYKQVLREEFYDFYTLKVDIYATINSPQSHWEALKKAEKRKSLALAWITNPAAEPNDTTPNLKNRINQLCPNPHTAILYWHLSPAQITTFLLQANQDPQVVKIIPCDPPTPEASEEQRRQINFTDWLKHYKTLYQDNRKKDADTPNPWQAQLPQLLDSLADILQLSDLLKHLEAIQHLILVPHRDLHLLPLHAFFSQQSRLESVTYLPQLNINPPKTSQPTTPPVLVGYPTSSKPIEFARRETSLVASRYPNATPVAGANVTATAFEQALQTSAPFLHFTGHGEHNAENPEASALYLADDEPFTLKQLLNLDSLNFPLVCLAACETGIANQGEFINEFVGFPAAFLAQGSRYILSTLWTVNEQSSMVFVVEFFRHYRQHQDPPRAFCHAQTQLQTLTYADLAQWYRHAMTEVEEFGSDWSWFKSLATNIENNPTQYDNPNPPYGDAYHWAGFVLTGQAHL